MPGENLALIKCLICDSENYFSPAAEKIASCSNCGAPIYNHNRPANVHDFNLYRAHLARWGEHYRATTQAKSKIEAQIKSGKEEQAKSSQLGQEMAKLQLALKQKNQAVAQLEAKLNEQSKQVAALQTELNQQEQKTNKLHIDLETARSKCDSWEKTYADFRLTAAGFTKTLQTVYEKQVKSIVTQLSTLVEDGSVTSRDSEEIEQDQKLKDSPKDSLLDQKGQPSHSSPPHNSLPQPAEVAHVPLDIGYGEDQRESGSGTQPLEKSVQTDAATDSTLVSTSVVKPIVPEWLEDYNNLESLWTARDFRKRARAMSLIVSQSSLENQRVALGDSPPKLLEGAGSYWCIYDDIAQTYFLLLNRETFKFNDTNYESITACYDFNNFNKSNIKLFKANDYKLNTYRIMQPAQVVPNESGEEWQLSLRGRLCFEKKAPS